MARGGLYWYDGAHVRRFQSRLRVYNIYDRTDVRYKSSRNPQLRGSMSRSEMSQRSLLRSVTEGKMTDVVAEVHCPSGFNLRNVLVTRESIWRVCGYGTSPTDRYLDDQVQMP